MACALDISLFLLLAVLWGFSFPAISVGLDYLPPILFAAIRYDVAALLLLGYAAIRAGTRLPRGRNDVQVVVGGVFLVAGNGFLFYSQQMVPSGVAAITQALVPIFTPLWALFLLDEYLSPIGARVSIDPRAETIRFE